MRRLILLLLVPLCLLASIVAGIRMLWSILFSPARAWQLAMAHDQLANAAFNGSMDETISSRANRARAIGRRWGCVLCKLLDRLDRDHCRRAAGF